MTDLLMLVFITGFFLLLWGIVHLCSSLLEDYMNSLTIIAGILALGLFIYLFSLLNLSGSDE